METKKTKKAKTKKQKQKKTKQNWITSLKKFTALKIKFTFH